MDGDRLSGWSIAALVGVEKREMAFANKIWYCFVCTQPNECYGPYTTTCIDIT